MSMSVMPIHACVRPAAKGNQTNRGRREERVITGRTNEPNRRELDAHVPFLCSALLRTQLHTFSSETRHFPETSSSVVSHTTPHDHREISNRPLVDHHPLFPFTHQTT